MQLYMIGGGLKTALTDAGLSINDEHVDYVVIGLDEKLQSQH